jgi:hypothetical protein
MKDTCRLVVTMELKFTEQAMNDAPAHRRHAIDILRDLLDEVLTPEFRQEFIYGFQGVSDLFTVENVKFEAGP